MDFCVDVNCIKLFVKGLDIDNKSIHVDISSYSDVSSGSLV